MAKKLLAVLLCMGMAVSMLAGCGAEKAPAAEAEKEDVAADAEVEEEAEEAEPAGDGEFKPGDEIPVDYFAGTEITVYWEKRATDESTDFNIDKPAVKACEEATGIHVNWMLAESGTNADKLPTILSSEDRPDVYLQTVGATQISADPDLFYDLTEEGLLETYAPKVVADYDSFGDTIWEAITWGDGSIYSLATGWGVSWPDTAGGIYVINKNWLERVGKAHPTNPEEFLDVLRAFRDQDANGNGDPSDEIPFGFCNNNWAANIMLFSDFWGLGSGPDCGATQHYYRIVDGKIVGNVETEPFKEFINFVALMVEEGLIDVEGFSQNNDQYSAKMQGDQYGIFSCWTPPVDMKDQYATLGLWEMMEGVTPIHSGYGEGGPTYHPASFVIDADTENVEAILHWWNWMSKDTATKRTFSGGLQGESWDFTEDGYVYEIPKDDYNANYAYTAGFHNACPVLLPDECTRANPNDPESMTLYRENMVKVILPYAVKEVLPKRFTTAEAEEERAFIETDLLAYIQNFTASNCMDGGVTDAEWEAHLKALEDNQYYEWLDWYQKYLDNNF
jgi:putative aldouronate transport system substrate-binding protein